MNSLFKNLKEYDEMKKFLLAGIGFLSVTTVYSTEIEIQNPNNTANYPITIEVKNINYSDYWAEKQYLQYGPNDKTSVPSIGQSKTIIINWNGVLNTDDSNFYGKSGWKDNDGNWWMPSGSIYVWRDYGDYKKNGKTGISLFSPGVNHGVKNGDNNSREYNKVIVSLIEGFPNPEVMLEFLKV